MKKQSVIILLPVLIGCSDVHLGNRFEQSEAQDITTTTLAPAAVTTTTTTTTTLGPRPDVDIFPELPPIPLHFVTVDSRSRQEVIDTLNALGETISSEEKNEILTQARPKLRAELKFKAYSLPAIQTNQMYPLTAFEYQIVFFLKDRQFSLTHFDLSFNQGLRGNIPSLIHSHAIGISQPTHWYTMLGLASGVFNSRGLALSIDGEYNLGEYLNIKVNFTSTEKSNGLIVNRVLLFATGDLENGQFNAPIVAPSLCRFAGPSLPQGCH